MNRSKRLSLNDRLEIHDLLISYAALLDLRRYDDLADLFVTSGVLDLGPTRLQGPKQIRAYFETHVVEARLHHVNSISLQCAGWDCMARSHYFETAWNPTRGETTLSNCGVFEDLLVHCNDRWKFGGRRFAPLDPRMSVQGLMTAREGTVECGLEH